jgi:hypothetical protein
MTCPMIFHVMGKIFGLRINLRLEKTVRAKGLETSYPGGPQRLHGGIVPKVSERERIAALEAKLRQLKIVQQRKHARVRTVEADF